MREIDIETKIESEKKERGRERGRNKTGTNMQKNDTTRLIEE